VITNNSITLYFFEIPLGFIVKTDAGYSYTSYSSNEELFIYHDQSFQSKNYTLWNSEKRESIELFHEFNEVLVNWSRQDILKGAGITSTDTKWDKLVKLSMVRVHRVDFYVQQTEDSDKEFNFHKNKKIPVNEPWALNKMALHLMNIGNKSESIQYHIKAAVKGDGHSQFSLGMHYYYEFLTCDISDASLNFSKCVFWLEQRAFVGGAGNIRAQSYLSEIYRINGFTEKADYWDKKIFEQDDSASRFFMRNFSSPRFSTREDHDNEDSPLLLENDVLESMAVEIKQFATTKEKVGETNES